MTTIALPPVYAPDIEGHTELRPARTLTFPLVHAPGIYFNMPADEYHDDKSFSASQSKSILISTFGYWAKSWMNPNRPEEKTSEGKQRGTAYHTIMLEGEDAFHKRYFVPPDTDKIPNLLRTGTELRAYADKLGVKGKSNLELARAIRQFDKDVPLLPLLEEQWAAEMGDRIELKSEEWRHLQLARYVITHLPSTRDVIAGGMPEVSIFWVGPHGIPMKARIDWLNRSIIDLKTFANQFDVEIREAVTKAIVRYGYWLQPAIYSEGIEAMKGLYHEIGDEIVRQGKVNKAWLAEVLTNPRTDFYFLFVQSGDVPDVVCRQFAEFEDYAENGATANEYWRRSRDGYLEAIARYLKCLTHYGFDEPWINDFGLAKFQDRDFPTYWIGALEDH